MNIPKRTFNKLIKEKMKKVYIIPTYHCNLNCPHCDLHLKNDNFNESFYKVLKNNDIEFGILFGGEPTLYKDRLIPCLKTNKIHSISTNLLNLDDELISLYKKYNLSIATSWNPQRFSEEQYKLWLNHLQLLSNNDLTCIIMITLTEDLLIYNDFENRLKEWDSLKCISGVLFEPLLDYNMAIDLHQRADEWLCQIYDKWCYSFKNIIVNKVKNWNCNCSDVWTLNPDGKLIRGCPQSEKEYVLNDCLKCKLAGICNPCNLQHLCSFPKKLYEKVKNEEKN